MPDYQQFMLWVLDVIFLLLRCHIYLSCNTPAFAIHYLRGYSLLLQAVFPFPTQFLVVSSRFSGSSKEHMMVSLIFTCEQVWNEIWAAHAGWFPPQSPTCASRPRSLWQALWNLLVSPIQVIFTLPKCREKKIKKKKRKKHQQLWRKNHLWDSAGNKRSSTARELLCDLQQTNPSVSVQGSPPASWR